MCIAETSFQNCILEITLQYPTLMKLHLKHFSSASVLKSQGNLIIPDWTTKELDSFFLMLFLHKEKIHTIV